MRLQASKKVHYDSGPNMTPLVDVVMVILIFLMLAGSFAGAEHFLASTVPITKSGVGGVVVAGSLPNEPVDIVVDPAVGGFTATVGYAQFADVEALTAHLQGMHEAFSSSQIDPATIQVRIRPARSVKYKHLIEVYQSAMEARFSKITFTTSR